jgi:hypothetical protein
VAGARDVAAGPGAHGRGHADRRSGIGTRAVSRAAALKPLRKRQSLAGLARRDRRLLRRAVKVYQLIDPARDRFVYAMKHDQVIRIRLD